MNNIKLNLNNLKKKIKEISHKNNISKKIKIIAVSKNQTIETIKLAISCGIKEFGENYVQESIKKINTLKSHKKIIWHFIGKVQSKKAKIIAKNFHWCQTIDREKIAILLNKYRLNALSPMNVLMQINVSNELNRNGVNINNYKKLAKIIHLMPNLNFKGIMVMPIIKKNTVDHNYYKVANIIFNKLKNKYKSVDTLSLGTSVDLNTSLIFKSNMIRIGYRIFNKK